MGSIEKIMKLCRLCLNNEHVNTPIFDEGQNVKQTYLKISSCLPVKVSRNDNLPKAICNVCSEKLDQFFVFWNTSATSEKQLIQWLENIGISSKTISTNVTPTITLNKSVAKTESYVKQETIEFVEVRNDIENKNIPEEQTNFSVQQEEYPGAFYDEENSSSKPNVTSMETDDEDDVDAAEAVTKVEDSEEDDSQDMFDTPSSDVDNQPGPSGVGKNVQAPLTEEETVFRYSCNVCLEEFSTKEEFLKHHINQYGEAFGCCKCGSKYKTISDLYKHLDVHKLENVLQGNDEETEEVQEVEEIILNYEDEDGVVVDETNEGNELFYILDDSQCVNEVVIEGEILDRAHRQQQQQQQQQQQEQIIEDDEVIEKDDNASYTIVQLEHGYMMPNVLNSKRTKNQIITRTIPSTTTKIQQPSTSKKIYTPPKPGRIPVKRRHVVPDFSSTNYTFVSPNEEVDIPHYKCLRCEQLFINKFVFFRHVEKGKCYINSCDVCSATFNKNSEFYYHYIVEHTDRAICNFCFRTFMYEKNVKEHMLRHLDQFRHRCEECNKGFYTVREYRNHYKNRHMGIRHKCSICGRSFADEYYFKRHLATHAKAVKVVTS